MNPFLLPACIAALLIASPAEARRMDCAMQETVSLSISFNQRVNGFNDAKAIFDAKTKIIEDIAKQQKISKFFLQNQNYNIYAQPDGNMPGDFTYQMNGSVGYQISDLTSATRLAEVLTQQHKMQVNLSSNSYRAGGSDCADTGIKE